MFKKLDVKDKHTDCLYCNRMGCTWSVAKYGPTLGHWLWVLSLGLDKITKTLNVKRQFRRLIRHLTRLDYSKIDNPVVVNVDTNDYPDFCDAFIESATYKGRDMTESELERLNEDSGYVYELACESLY